MIDGERGLGNGRCLPAGPLREPPGPARQVDLVIRNGGAGPRASLRAWSPARRSNLRDPGQTRAL